MSLFVITPLGQRELQFVNSIVSVIDTPAVQHYQLPDFIDQREEKF